MPIDIYKATTFLNVDLDLYSRSNLQPLVAALGQRAFTLHVGREGQTHSVHLELSREPKTADLAIRSLAALIDTLPKAERKLWDTHGVENPDGELLLLWVVAPLGLEMFFRQVASAPGAPPRQLTREQLNEIAQKHGMQFK